MHVEGLQVPKTGANTGKGTNKTPKETHRTGPKGDGDMPHPKEYVDGIEPVNGSENSPEKQPTRSTGIKSGKYPDATAAEYYTDDKTEHSS